MKTIFLFFSAYMLCADANAQTMKDVLTEFTALKKAYHTNGKCIEADVKYVYTKKSAPNKTLDSIAGHYVATDSFYAATLGSIDFLQNSNYFISCYKDQKIIDVKNAEAFSNSIMPTENWDSAYIQKHVKSFQLKKSPGLNTVSFGFTDSATYQSFSIEYDPSAYLISKMEYTLKQPPLMNHDGSLTYDPVVITIRFSTYKKKNCVAADFSEQRFVTGEKQLNAAAGYKGFSVTDRRRKKAEEK